MSTLDLCPFGTKVCCCLAHCYFKNSLVAGYWKAKVEAGREKVWQRVKPYMWLELVGNSTTGIRQWKQKTGRT